MRDIYASGASDTRTTRVGIHSYECEGGTESRQKALLWSAPEI
jgi:hypothetical protein